MFSFPWENEQDRWGHRLIYISNIFGATDDAYVLVSDFFYEED